MSSNPHTAYKGGFVRATPTCCSCSRGKYNRLTPSDQNNVKEVLQDTYSQHRQDAQGGAAAARYRRATRGDGDDEGPTC
jgi:hypothetical protein